MSREPGRPPRPAAAQAATDAESGIEPSDGEAELRALEVMHQRGLIDEETYRERRRALKGGAGPE
jgi:hypothetical protein